jgi:hypothetical protein
MVITVEARKCAKSLKKSLERVYPTHSDIAYYVLKSLEADVCHADSGTRHIGGVTFCHV